MAQLSDDSLAFGGKLATLDEVRAALQQRLTPVATIETVDVMAAGRRILAQDIIAPLAIPAFDNSAVDGYAVRIGDVAPVGDTRLMITNRVTAGSLAQHPLGAGEAARIFTGAPLPEGADTIFMQEDVRVEGAHVVVPAGLKRSANARFAGEDIAAGEIALRQGLRLRPQDVALASALGLADLPVRRRLVMALLSTGNEVMAPGGVVGNAGLYDANRPLLAALAQAAGCDIIDGGIVRDEPEALAAALTQAASEADVVISSGGVSTGEEDHVKAVIERIGRLDWWRIGIKPGRPVAAGVINGKAFVGLPGNPVAAYVTFTQIVRPLLAALSGETWRPPLGLPVRADFAYRKRAGRREFVRVSLGDEQPIRLARKHRQDGAGVITSLTASDGLVDLDEAITEVRPGDLLSFYPFAVIEA